MIKKFMLLMGIGKIGYQIDSVVLSIQDTNGV